VDEGEIFEREDMIIQLNADKGNAAKIEAVKLDAL
jgi:hypothetical protein